MDNRLENNYGLKEAIIKVIAFFDLFDYVLTDFEIWRLLSVKCELLEVIEALGNGAIESKNGFYFLIGQEKNIRVRLSRYNFTARKFKRAFLVSKIFKFIPWIKMIAVGNLLGAHNLQDDSDIDFFIIAESKRIWLVRFFCVGVIKFLGLRPRTNNSRDKICLSFYASESALDLSGLRLKASLAAFIKDSEALNLFSKPQDMSLIKEIDNVDIYFIYWLAGLTSFYDAGGVYKKFMAANSWLKNYLPNWQPINPVRRWQVKPFLSEFYHDLADLFIGGLEPQVKALQLKLLPPQLKNIMNQDSRVAVNDQIIKLHANDRRSEYRERYYRKIYETYRKNN